MAKNSKKPSNSKTPTSSSNPSSSCCGSKALPLILAAGVGFIAAFLFLRGCPMSSSVCPIYSEACPVTSTLQKARLAVDKEDLPEAKKQAEKLGDQLRSSMPDLADLAVKLSNARDLAEARNTLQALETKMISDVSHPPRK